MNTNPPEDANAELGPQGHGSEREPGSERDLVEILAAEYTEKLRQGAEPSISEYASRHPERAEEIRELLGTIAAVERVKVQNRASSDGRATLGGARPERLGDFRIVREIGRGGMGIVYEAEQESLGRRVAVKVLPRQLLLEPSHLRRFDREAKTAAKLHHTNIVPVFGVGEQEGYHYYVMQYIDGVGLDHVLHELRRAGNRPLRQIAADLARDGSSPTPTTRVRATTHLLIDGRVGREPEVSEPAETGKESGGRPAAGPEDEPPEDRSGSEARRAPPGTALPLDRRYFEGVARIGLQVSEAVHYAHTQGTLHRDVKPGNLLVDSAGVVWITDFGLARAVEQDGVSQSGDLVGTLRYIAPEQFSGQVDARSDIYSLGLTLYELLTLQPAYEDTHRSRLIRKITQTSPPRPRKIRREIPRDLETVVLKATAREPSHRYPTAGELARDLQRFLEDRPVLARRTHPLVRFWRWSRRNRAVASLAAAAIALLVLVAVVATTGYVRTERQRAKSQAVSVLATEALDRIFEQFAPNRLVPSSDVTVEDAEGEEIEVPVQPVLSKESAALLEQLLDFYRRIAELGGDDARIFRETAEANRRVGDIRQRLGNLEEAKVAYSRALEILESLQADSRGDDGLRVQVARIHNELGAVHEGLSEGGEESHREALSILEEATGEPAALPELRFELARSHYYLGRRPEPGPRPEAPLSPGLPGGGPGPIGPRRGPGEGRLGPPPPTPPRDVDDGPGPAMEGEPRGAPERPWRRRGPRSGGDRGPPFPFDRGPRDGGAREQHLREATRILEELVEEHPAIPDYRHLLARCYLALPPGLPVADGEPAPTAREMATKLLGDLVRDFPGIADYRYDLSESYAAVELPRPFFRFGAPGLLAEDDSATYAAAAKRLSEALAISEQLVAEHPNVPDYGSSQVRMRHRLAGVLWRSGERDPAVAQLEKARALQASLADRFPEISAYRVWLAVIQQSLAHFRIDLGDNAQARTLLEESTGMLESLVEKAPGMRDARGILGVSYLTLAEVLRKMGDDEGAEKARQKALEHRPRFRR